jgi:beta-glucosidase
MERDSRKRAEALLAQMTATEKVGQLNQHLYGFRIYHVEDGKIVFSQELKDEVEKMGRDRHDLWSLPCRSMVGKKL